MNKKYKKNYKGGDMKRIILIIILLSIVRISFAQWKSTNGPGSKYVSCIMIDSNEIIVNSGLGIFKSTDEGKNWKVINDKNFIDFGTINGIIKKDNTLFFGTWYGVYKTEDMGITWNKINDGLPENACYIVKMLKTGGDIYSLTTNGLYLHNEKENKWSVPYDSIFKPIYTSFSTIINKDDYFYLGMEIEQSPKTTQANILISSDKGKTWRGITDTLSGIANYSIRSFALKDSLIFAGTNNGVFVSLNNGESWTEKNEGIFWKDIIVLHVVDDIIFAGTSGGAVFYSTDNGESWSLRNIGLKGILILTIESYGNKVFAGTDKGIFVSDDYGATWNSISSGLSGGLVFDIYEETGKLYAGLYAQGIYVSNDFGKNWSVFSNKYQNSSIYRIAINDSNIYTGLYMPGGLLYSNDLGQNWSKAKDTNGLKNQRINCFEFVNNRLYAGTGKGIYYTDNNGKSWESLNNDLEIYRITSMIISGNNILAGTDKNGIFISTDVGETWTSNSISFTEIIISDFLINDNEIFAATVNSQDDYAPVPWKGIFKSTDWGKSWKQVNNGLPERAVACLANYGSNIFAGLKEDGIYLSTNNGESWYNISLGLTDNNINKLLIINDKIFAATTAGVYKAKLSDFGITDVSDEQTEVNNYLWAFNPYPLPASHEVRTKIYWDASIDIEDDEINVYDIYGNKVADKDDVVIDKMTKYSGILKWDCSAVNSGIYLIHIKHGTRDWTIKVMVNR
jgi:photosystem II stability/assembly factor-like uncharacterized protein